MLSSGLASVDSRMSTQVVPKKIGGINPAAIGRNANVLLGLRLSATKAVTVSQAVIIQMAKKNHLAHSIRLGAGTRSNCQFSGIKPGLSGAKASQPKP